MPSLTSLISADSESRSDSGHAPTCPTLCGQVHGQRFRHAVVWGRMETRMLARISERIAHPLMQRRGKLLRLTGVLEGPALVTLGPILLLTGHAGYMTAALCTLAGLGATARAVGKFATKRARLRRFAPLLHVTSYSLERASELAHPEEFLSIRLSTLIFDPLVKGAMSLLRGTAALIVGQRRNAQPALPPDWQAPVEVKPRGLCPSCGHELVTNMPHCPACGTLLSSRETGGAFPLMREPESINADRASECAAQTRN